MRLCSDVDGEAKIKGCVDPSYPHTFRQISPPVLSPAVRPSRTVPVLRRLELRPPAFYNRTLSGVNFSSLNKRCTTLRQLRTQSPSTAPSETVAMVALTWQMILLHVLRQQVFRTGPSWLPF